MEVRMKRVSITTVVFLCVLASSMAQAPRMINYQGRLVKDGIPSNGTANLVFNLYTNSNVGSATNYTFATNGVPVTNGLYSVMIGNPTFTNLLDALTNASLYLGVSVDGGTELTPRTQLASVPYALKAEGLTYATNALNAATNALNTRVGTAETDINNLEASTNALNTRVGTAETDINNLEASTNALDTRVTAVETGKLALVGGTMSGALNMQGNIITNATITNTTYYGNGFGITNLPAGAYTETDPLWANASNAIVTNIEARLASNVWAAADSTTNYVVRTGGTMSGALNMQGNIITNATITNTTYYGNGVGITNVPLLSIIGGFNATITNVVGTYTQLLYFTSGILTNVAGVP